MAHNRGKKTDNQITHHNCVGFASCGRGSFGVPVADRCAPSRVGAILLARASSLGGTGGRGVVPGVACGVLRGAVNRKASVVHADRHRRCGRVFVGRGVESLLLLPVGTDGRGRGDGYRRDALPRVLLRHLLLSAALFAVAVPTAMIALGTADTIDAVRSGLCMPSIVVGLGVPFMPLKWKRRRRKRRYHVAAR